MSEKQSKKFPECPYCHCDLGRHSYMDVGSALLESIEETQLNEAIKNQQWTEAARFQAANTMSDIKIWRTFFCEEKAILVSLVSKLELWDDDIYGEPVIISDPEARKALLTEIRSGK